jgi:hypothetical protein
MARNIGKHDLRLTLVLVTRLKSDWKLLPVLSLREPLWEDHEFSLARASATLYVRIRWPGRLAEGEVRSFEIKVG